MNTSRSILGRWRLPIACAVFSSALGTGCTSPKGDEDTGGGSGGSAGASEGGSAGTASDGGSAGSGSPAGGSASGGTGNTTGSEAGASSSGGSAGEASTGSGDDGATTAGSGGSSDGGSGGDTVGTGDTGGTGGSTGSGAGGGVSVSELEPITIPLDEETILDSSRCEWTSIGAQTVGVLGLSEAFTYETSPVRVSRCTADSLIQTDVSPPHYVYDTIPWTDGATPLDDYEGRMEFSFVAATGAGLIYTLGRASQLPGEALGLSDSPLLAGFDLEGQRSWEHRLESLDFRGFETYEWDSLGSAAVPQNPSPAAGHVGVWDAVSDGDGKLYLHLTVDTRAAVARIGESGDVEAVTHYDALLTPPQYVSWVEWAAAEANGNALFVFYPGDVADHPDGSLSRLALDGSASWSRQLSFEHETVLDPVEGVIWRGESNAYDPGNHQLVHPLTVRADGSVCIAQQYQNTYQYGSTTRWPHDNVMIACLSPDGEVLWAKQYGLPFDSPFDQ